MKYGKDFKKVLTNDLLNGMSESHLEGWSERYAEYKKVSDVRIDLNVNHDPSIEIEKIEELLGRKLNTQESDYLVEIFNMFVVKNCKKYINK